MKKTNLEENIIAYIEQNLPTERGTKVNGGFVEGVHIYYCYAFPHADKDNKNYHLIVVTSHEQEVSFMFNSEN